MCLLLLGSLYLYVVISMVKSTTDPYLSYESSGEFSDFENCTQCSVKPSASVCLRSDGNTCLICTQLTQCCYCDDCAMCRTRRIIRARCILMQEEHNTATHCSTIESLRERPPSYSDVCGAPPLYTSPYNRASMQEAPPRYPGSPKLEERSRNTNDTLAPSTPSVAQHM